jgi:hypothetical protein
MPQVCAVTMEEGFRRKGMISQLWYHWKSAVKKRIEKLSKTIKCFFFVSKGKKGVRLERQSEVKKGGLTPLFPPAFFTSLTAQRKENPQIPNALGFSLH